MQRPIQHLSFITLAMVLMACSSVLHPSSTATASLFPSPSPLTTLAPSSSPLPSITPTVTAIPTATLDPSFSGGSGILTYNQKHRLAETSRQYLASTESQAITVARSLDYASGAEHPSYMCGPLSIAILQKAGLFDPAVEIHQFWLLDPRPEAQLPFLQHVFPAERYDWIRIATAIDKIDFTKDPLFPGDFVYIFAGTGGTFEHMFTVSRVDSTGCAFTVTNLHTAKGYTIEENHALRSRHAGCRSDL